LYVFAFLGDVERRGGAWLFDSGEERGTALRLEVSLSLVSDSNYLDRECSLFFFGRASRGWNNTRSKHKIVSTRDTSPTTKHVTANQ
jgi:hypothetical protein